MSEQKELRVPIDDKTSVVFDRFRSDGWPLCPRCGEDELFSYLMLQWTKVERPSIEECLDGGMGCYNCRFRLPPREQRGPKTVRVFIDNEEIGTTDPRGVVGEWLLEAGVAPDRLDPESFGPTTRLEDVRAQLKAEHEARIRAEVEAMDWPEVIGVPWLPE